MQLLYRKMQRFRGGLVFKARRRLNHSTLGVRVIKRKQNGREQFGSLNVVLPEARSRFWA